MPVCGPRAASAAASSRVRLRLFFVHTPTRTFDFQSIRTLSREAAKCRMKEQKTEKKHISVVSAESNSNETRLILIGTRKLIV